MKIRIIKESKITEQAEGEAAFGDSPKPDLSPEELLKKFKDDPSVLNDYANFAEGNPPPGGGFPEYLTQEFAKQKLMSVAVLALSQLPVDDHYNLIKNYISKGTLCDDEGWS